MSNVDFGWLRHLKLINFGQKKAKEEADKFKGFGPLLFGLKEKAWKSWLGDHEGYSIFSMILEMKNRAGALPRDMVVGPTQVDELPSS
jgi:hypothetical protein